MRLSTIVHDGSRTLGTAEGPGAPWRLAPGHLRLEDAIAGAPIPEGGETVPDEEAVPALPHRPGTIFGIGLNYRDTIAEMGWPRPEVPYLFTKLSSSAIGTGEPIVLDPAVTRRVDWETELAVVIGSEARDIPEERALDVVFGYTVANDVSARDLQADDGQWVRGKGLDTFCPLGPVVVTADEIKDPQRLAVRTWVNGEQVQDGTTADMLFGVRSLIAYLSRFFTLRPGDVILTGTPSGCGDFMDPPRALRPGDVVESEVEGIGRLVNPVRARRHP
ncbi:MULTISPECIES: fumarylacetoacetate hydrolase family protein [Streptomyces]|uniref:Fumarylacetoacetate hydrolase family protein n=1 Tax=Streptomyces rhizosphaericus TaxID=114699 RepID=A0A6G4ADB5_9ACTN|nr:MULTISPECIES: fumarylacetoacetate hydrolase family protein [Streptomyces]MBD3002613.1 fumarylacetoacetate hydrolase family protein [Streptomyces sp. 5-10]NEW70824.1 fumarylacetoacetate hydrolase family protein [Streptomyces rhizosphaericus]